jgi:uncharacterized protein (DUF1015 family)
MYAARSAKNIVHLTLPESQPDDRSKFVKYARSAADLAAWRREGVLQPEAAPAVYRYTQTFSVPRMPEKFTRTSMIALIKTEPYSKGVVLPHEQTFPKHKEDRMRVLEATRAHLECIFGLYEDPSGGVLDSLKAANAESRHECLSDDGVHQVLEPISDPATVAEILQQFEDKRIWIADGHHRYETAVSFREKLGEQPGIVAEDFMMMALSSMSDPGLALLPTHRIVKKLDLSAEELRQRFSAHFDVSEAPNATLLDKIEAIAAAGGKAFGIALPGGNGLILQVRDLDTLASEVGGEGSADLRRLDVSILHSVIFEKMLGLTGIDFFDYTRDPDEAISAVENGAGGSFLMNPPSVEEMRVVALKGEKMPQKSTYYFPKILSGLVVWSLADFD